MKEVMRTSPFPLRLDRAVRERAAAEAREFRRSLNTELAILIEEGFKWREMQSKQAAA